MFGCEVRHSNACSAILEPPGLLSTELPPTLSHSTRKDGAAAFFGVVHAAKNIRVNHSGGILGDRDPSTTRTLRERSIFFAQDDNMLVMENVWVPTSGIVLFFFAENSCLRLLRRIPIEG